MLAVLVADVVLSLAFAADVVLSLAFVADVVPFQVLMVFDEKMHLLQKVRFELLEISKFGKRGKEYIYTIFKAMVIVSCSSAMRRASRLRELEALGKAGSSRCLDMI